MSRPSRETSLVVGIATGVAVLTIAQQIASKAVRDGVFLTEYEVTALPIAVVAGAAASFVAAVLLGRAMAVLSPSVAVPLIFAANALAYLTESLFATEAPAWVAAALYLHTAAFGGAVVSGFWSVVNERFDPLEFVLLLLALTGKGRELRLAFVAATSGNPSRRGTGLEYLDNLLPGNLKGRLLTLVESPERTRAARHVVPGEVIEALAEELRSGSIGLKELRVRYEAAKGAQL